MKKPVVKKSASKELSVIKRKSTSLSAQIDKMVICSVETLNSAVVLLKDIVAARKKAETLFDPQIKATHAAWKISLDQKKEFITPMLEAEKQIKNKKTVYELEQEKIYEKAKALADEKARKKEEKERARLAKKIEKTEDEEEIAVLEEEMECVNIAPDIAVEQPGKVDGMAKQADWDIEIVSLKKLLKAIVDDEVPINLDNLVKVKPGVLKTYLKMSGKNTLPGCTVKKTFIQKVV